jgi:tetratricopeptide (TPR) repeat protein
MKDRYDKARILELAERQVKAGRTEEAIAEYKKLLSGENPDLTINNIIGDLYLQLGRTGEAVRAFQAVAGHYEAKGHYSQALAIYKKITKIDPGNVIMIVRLGDLLNSQGFAEEARKEYLKAEHALRREKRVKELMFLYNKLIRLERDNISYKLNLAELLRQEGFADEAVAQFNEASEIHLRRDEPEKAEKVIEQARQVKPEDERTLTNLVEVLKRRNRRKQALEVIGEVLKKDEDNIHFQTLLGSLHLEDQDLDKAEAIFSRIVAVHPNEVRARIKLGKVYVLQGRPDKAYDLYDPLVAGMLKKQKEDTAIGLLGVILGAEQLYLPALERLAAIYKAKNHKSHLEVVNRVIFEEAKAKGLTEKVFVALAELLELRPRDKELNREYRELRKDLGFVDEKTGEADTLQAIEAEEGDIDLLLSRVDLYVNQGLVRNARRILENLDLRFPHSPKIEAKIAALDEVKARIRTEEIPVAVGKVQDIEATIEAKPEPARVTLSAIEGEAGAGKRITSADLFADTEIRPLPVAEAEAARFYDLSQKIVDEREMIQNVSAQQVRGDISILEKELSEIVSTFQEQVRKKIDTKDYETRFNLGLAYLEQGLIPEAIEEFLLASEDPGRALECASIISKAYEQNNNYIEALNWLEKSLTLVTVGSPEHYAILYELASVHEENGDRRKALELYRRVGEWNPAYREVLKKIDKLA